MSAATDAYVEANLLAAKQQAPQNGASGMKLRVLLVPWVRGTEGDGSIYRIIKNFNPNAIIRGIRMAGDANAGMTAIDCGLYASNKDPLSTALASGGAVISDNVFANNVNVAAGAANFDPGTGFNLFTVAPQLRGRKVYEHAGHTEITKAGGYDLCLTADTNGVTGATNHVVEVAFLEP